MVITVQDLEAALAAAWQAGFDAWPRVSAERAEHFRAIYSHQAATDLVVTESIREKLDSI